MINVSGEVTVTVLVDSGCGEEGADQYTWQAFCGEGTPEPEGIDVAANGDGTNDFLCYPNPFTSTLTMEANMEETFTGEIVITNYQGIEMLRQVTHFEEGYNTFEIEALTDLNAGLYIVSILQDGAIKAAQTIVKM